MSRPSNRHLIIFVKAPALGRVKRRLAAEIGAVPAWVFYRRNVQAVVRRLGRDPRWRTWMAITPEDMVAVGRWWPTAPARMGQGRGDLGRRMDRALRAVPSGPAVLVGGDIPAITQADIEAAFRVLGNRSFVFGPAADGGYWLVGAKRRPRFPYIFADVRWSSSTALSDTVANIAAPQQFGLLRVLHDVDNEAALRRFRNSRD